MVRLIPLEQAKTKQQSEVDVNQAQSVRPHGPEKNCNQAD